MERFSVVPHGKEETVKLLPGTEVGNVMIEKAFDKNVVC